jgi:predicted nucleotidyltransferase
MIDEKSIHELSESIAREFEPERIILFGSYGCGSPSEDSDVDLLVIMPFISDPVDKAVEIRLKVRPGFPLDLLVRTPDKVQERLEMGDHFMREIIEEGKVLYEADHG